MKQRLNQRWQVLQRTRIVRSYRRFGEQRGSRLAGAVTFYAFVSLFPLLLLGVAIASELIGDEAVAALQDVVSENLPNVEINVESIQANATSLGLIGIGVLIFTGLRVVDALRAAARSMWQLDDKPGNFFWLKVQDLISLVGLGLVLVTSVSISAVVGALAEQLFDLLGIVSTPGQVTLQALTYMLAILASSLFFAYLLSGLPRIKMDTGLLIRAALAGGVVFEILKFVTVRLLTPGDNPTQAAFSAFAAPLVLLAWLYLVTRLLMFLAAYTAEVTMIERVEDAEERAHREYADWRDTVSDEELEAEFGPPVSRGVPGTENLVLTPTAAQARGVGVVSGAILGAVGTGAVLLVRQATRTLSAAVRRRPPGGG